MQTGCSGRSIQSLYVCKCWEQMQDCELYSQRSPSYRFCKSFANLCMFVIWVCKGMEKWLGRIANHNCLAHKGMHRSDTNQVTYQFHIKNQTVHIVVTTVQAIAASCSRHPVHCFTMKLYYHSTSVASAWQGWGNDSLLLASNQ